MFLSHPNSAAFSPKSPWTFGPQTRHEYTNYSTEPATCNATGHASKKSALRRMLFQLNSETQPSYSIYPANRSDCSRPWNISLCIYEKSVTMFILLLKDVIFTLQDFTDCTGRLQSVSRLNNNDGNAETKAVAVFYSSYRSLDHILIYYCRTAFETFFSELRRPELPLLTRQTERWNLLRYLHLYNHQVGNTTDLLAWAKKKKQLLSDFH